MHKRAKHRDNCGKQIAGEKMFSTLLGAGVTVSYDVICHVLKARCQDTHKNPLPHEMCIAAWRAQAKMRGLFAAGMPPENLPGSLWKNRGKFSDQHDSGKETGKYSQTEQTEDKQGNAASAESIR
jgi:hypothetical protein